MDDETRSPRERVSKDRQESAATPGGRLALGQAFTQPKIDWGVLTGSNIDWGALTQPEIDWGVLTGSVALDPFVGAGFDFGKLINSGVGASSVVGSMDASIIAKALTTVRIDSLSAAAHAARAASQILERTQASSVDADVRRLLEDDEAVTLPDRLLELGSQGIDSIPAEDLEPIVEALPASEDSERRTPTMVGICLFLGAVLLVVTIHNSLAAAENPETAQFISSFFDQVDSYVALAALILMSRSNP